MKKLFYLLLLSVLILSCESKSGQRIDNVVYDMRNNNVFINRINSHTDTATIYAAYSKQLSGELDSYTFIISDRDSLYVIESSSRAAYMYFNKCKIGDKLK